MNGYQALLEKLTSLQSQQAGIRAQDDVLLDCSVKAVWNCQN
ncbi:hypothetical protein [Oculatella sp. FACHB-28]|nr:hypothetical protein [Oculatella sp. FACHB-28]